MDEVVNQEEVVVTEQPAAETVVTDPEPKPGEKTDSALLLESLQKEREKRKKLEEDLEAEKLKNQQPTGEVFSDEGKVLLGKIATLEGKLSSKEQQEALQAVETKYAPLKDKAAEFEQFRADNPGMKIETAAKAFLVENDLLEAPKPRKGLENASGGGRTPVTSDKMTAEDVDTLRTTNYRKYSDMVRKGLIKL